MKNASRIVASLLGASALCVLAVAQTTPPPEGPGRGEGGQGNRQGRGGSPEQQVDRLMQGDTDGDGKLSKSEVPERLAERMFDQADKNTDGFLDREELLGFFSTRRGPGGEGRGGAGGPGGGLGAGGGAGGPPGAEGRGPAMDFEGHMSQAGRGLRRIQRSSFDASSMEGDLEAIQNIQSGLIGAKAQISTIEMSDSARAKYGDDKATYAKEFRTHLVKAAAEALHLEAAILEGNGDAARASVKNLAALQEAAHAIFEK